MKTDKLQLMQEANRRGILPADKKPLYEEAVRRGLIQDEMVPDLADQPSAQPISRAEAALETVTNIPFAPRIKAGIAALGAKGYGMATGEPVGEESLGDLYGEALQDKRGKLAQAREQYPIQSIATQLPADIAVGGAALKRMGLAGGGIKSAMGGAAALSGLQAVGETKDLRDIGQTASDAGSAAMLAGVTSGALGLVGKGVKGAFAPKQVKVNADDFRGLASTAYKTAAEKGGVWTPQVMNNILKKAGELDKQTAIGKAMSGNSPISVAKAKLAAFANKDLSLESFQELDESLGDLVDEYMENGIIKKAGLPILQLQNHIRKMVDDPAPELIKGGKEGFEALKDARKLWAKSAKLRDIERILIKADISDNPAPVIKRGFAAIFTNDGWIKSFNKEEQKLIKESATSGKMGDLLKTLESRFIPIGSIVAGGGLPAAMAGQLTNIASKGLSARSQMAKAEKVAEQIIRGSQPKIPQRVSTLNPILAARLGSSMAMNSDPNSGEAYAAQPTREDIKQMYQQASSTTHYVPDDQELNRILGQQQNLQRRRDIIERYKQAYPVTRYMPDDQEIDRILQQQNR